MTDTPAPADRGLEKPAFALPPEADPYTSMVEGFGWPSRFFGRRFFSGFHFEKGDVERVRELEDAGAVIFVMRYASRLDYFLFNWLFIGAGLRPSAFANVRYVLYRPVGEALRLITRHAVERLRDGRSSVRERGISRLRRIIGSGQSAFLFLRSDKIGTRVRGRAGALVTGRSELDYLREVVDTTFAGDKPVALVPLTLFWRKGPRAQRRFLNLFYGGPERPTDVGKVAAFLWNYKNLAVRVGEAIDLRTYVDQRRSEGRERVVKQVRRSLLIYLRREEKPVVGSALRSFERIQQAVLEGPDVREAIRAAAVEAGRPPARFEARARGYVGEIAANPSPTALYILDMLVGWIFRKMFARFEVKNLDTVINAAKLNPIVIVPSHRSHFDYLILSWLFYERHMVPPQIAAGINLAFWPLGPIFRRAGAFFLRRTFDGDPLYAAVFRGYVQLLIKDGITSEFFIEGTRSRTGKTLRPRLGMLRMVLEAYARGARRELYIVPVGFTYERLVEEASMTEERLGAAKQRETLGALLRATRVLRKRFGSVTVRFGEPISVADAVDAARSEAGLPADDRRTHFDLRPATETLGVEISRRINELVTAGRSSVAATALLSRPAQGVRLADFREEVARTAEMLTLLDVPRSENLERCLALERPEATAALLLQSGLVKRRSTARGELLEIDTKLRASLDYYRTTLSPALVWPAVLGWSLFEPAPPERVITRASDWLDLLRLEFFPVEADARKERLERVLAYFAESGWVESRPDGTLAVTGTGERWLGFFRAQVRPLLEGYTALFAAVGDLAGPEEGKAVLADAEGILKEAILLGEARFPESVHPTTFGNALAWLAAAGVVDCEGNPSRSDSKWAPAEAEIARLTAWQRRLASALASD